MRGVHLVPVRGRRFILGRVRHLAGNPGDVKAVKVIKPGSVKIVIVEDQDTKDVVILDDEVCSKLIVRKWNEYVKDYSAKKNHRVRKTEGTIVEPPVEFTLDDLRKMGLFVEIKSVNFTVFLDRDNILGVEGEGDNFLGLCKKIRDFAGDKKIKFNREKIHEEI